PRRARRHRRLSGERARCEPLHARARAGHPRRGRRRAGMGLLLQCAARPRPADRVGRLLPPSQRQTMTKKLRHAFATLAFITGVGASLQHTATLYAQTAAAGDLDPRIAQLVQTVSEDRLTAILKKLESFGTRSTLSSQDKPDRGIGAARQWIFDEIKGYSPKLQVSFDTYVVAKQGRVTHDVEVR